MKSRKTLLVTGGATLILGLGMMQACAATTTHKVQDLVLQSGNPGITLSTGYNTLETATIDCRQASCTLGLAIMSTVSEATCTEEWAIIGLVDGQSVDGGPDQDELPHAGNTQTRNWQGDYQVSNGKHTIAFQIYTPCAVNANQWSVNYTVTTP